MIFTGNNVVVDTDVLVEIFLKILSDTNMIDNKTYLSAIHNLNEEKGDVNNVDTE